MADDLDIEHDPGQPMVYQIRIRSRLGPQWTDWFGGLTITPTEGGETLLTGPVEDQAALHGLLKRVRDLGMPLISVSRVEAGHADASDVKQSIERGERKMTTNAHKEKKMDMKSKLSTLWIFAALNYLYCDVLGLMDPELLPQFLRGNINGLEITPGFLLGAGILVEIPIAMVLLSRVLPYRADRWANIAAGTVMTVVQSVSLFVGTPAPYYLFFSVIEIATTVLIVWFGWNWRESIARVELNEPDSRRRRPGGGVPAGVR